MADEKKTEKPESKMDERAKKFWMAFLFTKDGRPKSGFGVYTFFLSLLMVFVYAGTIIASISLLNAPLSAVCAPWAENLIESLCSAVAGALIATLLHYILPEKNMMFAAYLWIAAYILAIIITMLIYLRGTGAFGLFMEAFLWFALLPVGIGLICTFLLFRRDYRPRKAPEPEPEYMKYLHRR